MRLAAIDIGSNGARLLIKNFRPIGDDEILISRVMYMRVPLRLGADVFTLGKVSKRRAHMMRHMLKAFKQIMKLNGVDDYRACATSAMRDAENGKSVLRRLRTDTGIALDIITGSEEARLLCNNIVERIESKTGNYVYIDVGGGSTEVSFLHDGTLTHGRSYNIGTLRMLGGNVPKSAFEEMRGDMARFAAEMPDIHIIGSGGNINKLFKLSHGDKKSRTVSLAELQGIYDQLKPLSIDERIERFGLKADRADVIIPAAEIFLAAARALRCDTIHVPNISLADSIIDGLYREKYECES